MYILPHLIYFYVFQLTPYKKTVFVCDKIRLIYGFFPSLGKIIKQKKNSKTVAQSEEQCTKGFPPLSRLIVFIFSKNDINPSNLLRPEINLKKTVKMLFFRGRKNTMWYVFIVALFNARSQVQVVFDWREFFETLFS